MHSRAISTREDNVTYQALSTTIFDPSGLGLGTRVLRRLLRHGGATADPVTPFRAAWTRAISAIPA